MKQFNTLFLGGAKRVTMARLFKQAAEQLGSTAQIYSYEMEQHVPIACCGTVVIGKRWRDDDIYEHLLSVVEQYDINVMIPFVDGAVGVAAEFVARYPQAGVFVPTGSRQLAEAMFDKVEAARLFEKLELPIPRTYKAGDPCLRLIAKPRNGSASKGIVNINSLDTLDTILAKGDDYLIQERIDNREEYTVDCYVTVGKGEIIAVSPRRRIEVIGGEVSRTITVDDKAITQLAERTLQLTGLRGAVTVQVIRDLDNGNYMIMEINPRLGGGAVCSVEAGANLPLAILNEAAGKAAELFTADAGVELVRYMESVIFRNNK
jgi:carbamoyl-phosphate synthase large subunit